MIWTLEYGRNVKQLEAMHAAGKQVPAIENRPSVLGWTWLWEAFWALNTCRSIGMTAGPIPWTAVQQYASAEELNGEETDMLHQVVRHLDEKLLAHHRAKGEAKTMAKTKTLGAQRGVARGNARR